MTGGSIDLNADVGEIPAALADGTEERLLGLVTSANIACGGHAGSVESMETVVAIAGRLHVSIGAHPGYPDPANFGRREMSMSREEIGGTVLAQVSALMDVARRQEATVRHVKPHGALYNVAAKDAGVASAIAAGLKPWRDELVLVGLAGSTMLDVWRDAGFQVAAEAFADRAYEPDGTLRARRHPDALITDPAVAAQQALEIAANGRVFPVTGSPIPVSAETLCVHGDTPNVIEILGAVRYELKSRGIEVRGVQRR